MSARKMAESLDVVAAAIAAMERSGRRTLALAVYARWRAVYSRRVLMSHGLARRAAEAVSRRA